MALGDGIRRRLAAATDGWTDILEPARDAIEVPLVGNGGGTGSHVKLGWFYENLYAGLFGGIRCLDLLSKGPARRLPDVVEGEGAVFAEVKGCCVDKTTQLRDNQVEVYRILQNDYPDAELRLAIFRHCFPLIRSYDGPEEDLYRLLVGRTLYGLVLPFSMMLRLHEHKGIGGLVRRYNEAEPLVGVHSYESCACIRGTTMHRLLSEPEQVVEEIGLPAEEYRVTRLLTPEGLPVNGVPLPSFPIARIAHLREEKWRREWLARYVPDPGIYDTHIDPLAELKEAVPPPGTVEEIPF